MYRIGVLALQGDFAKHIQALLNLGQHAFEVRCKADLKKADALILPGGESTTVLKLLHESGFNKDIHTFLDTHPAMGTCAGLIILARKVANLPYDPLNLIDITVNRNAYGRQRESFVDKIRVNLNGIESSVEGVFIRAPQITQYGPDVRILGYHNGMPVLAANKHILVCTFHPELTHDLSLHQYFIDYFIRQK